MNWSKLIIVSALATLGLNLTGCKQVTIVNGEIPAEYLELAKNYMKTYHGSFEGNSGDLGLSLNGKKVVLSFAGKVNDITGDDRCQSQIGNLTSLQINNKGTQVESATFDFTPNHCYYIEGRNLNLSFSRDGTQFTASILREMRPYVTCQVTPPPTSVQVCQTNYQYFWMYGAFSN
jgi:hypothetical protein